MKLNFHSVSKLNFVGHGEALSSGEEAVLRTFLVDDNTRPILGWCKRHSAKSLVCNTYDFQYYEMYAPYYILSSR